VELLKSYTELAARKDDNFSEYERRMLDEGLYGADYLVRIKRPQRIVFRNDQRAGQGETRAGPGDRKS